MNIETLMQILYGFAGGVVGSLFGYGVLTLKLFRLQLVIGAIQQGLLSVRNTTANKIRQEKKISEEEFLASMSQQPKSKYANDPPWG
jgi:hypothetical protein